MPDNTKVTVSLSSCAKIQGPNVATGRRVGLSPAIEVVFAKVVAACFCFPKVRRNAQQPPSLHRDAQFNNDNVDFASSAFM